MLGRALVERQQLSPMFELKLMAGFAAIQVDEPAARPRGI